MQSHSENLTKYFLFRAAIIFILVFLSVYFLNLHDFLKDDFNDIASAGFRLYLFVVGLICIAFFLIIEAIVRLLQKEKAKMIINLILVVAFFVVVRLSLIILV